MRYAIVMTLLLLLLASSAVQADDKPPGDASHCLPLALLDDARNYSDCIDAARQEAISALTAGTHPDASTERPRVGITFDEDGRVIHEPEHPPYQRYENFEGRRRRSVYLRHNTWGPGTLRGTDKVTPDQQEYTMNYPLLDGTSVSVTFRRTELGLEGNHPPSGWRWAWFQYGCTGVWPAPFCTVAERENKRLLAWQAIAFEEENDIIAPPYRGHGIVRLGAKVQATVSGDCVTVTVRGEGGLRTEHPRRCLPG